MKVTLAGPDDLGYWFLHDEDGNAFPLVEDHAGHPAAAALFGWTAPEGVTDEEEIIQDALNCLMDHISEEIDAPAHIEAFFRELEDDEADE
jgi:hypothetical protein